MALSSSSPPPRPGWLLPTRPEPLHVVAPPPDAAGAAGVPLDARRLVGMSRVGSASVSPDGSLAAFEVREYNFEVKKFDEQLWLMDLRVAEKASPEDLRAKKHLTQLTAGSQHGWSSANTPVWSPCGRFVAFLSDRSTGTDPAKTCVWITPATVPGGARLLAAFPLPVGDLTWPHGAAGGLVVSASVYVGPGAPPADPMGDTAARDAVLADADGKLGGLDAVLFRRLPVREWDRWLDGKMKHPFFVRVGVGTDGHYRADGAEAVDVLRGVPTAVPAGAFGGSGDWALSLAGAVAFSARPPVAEDEAWTTNQHIYLLDRIPDGTRGDGGDRGNGGKGEGGAAAALLGRCLTVDNPGYDTAPVFSPDGKRLAWLTTARPAHESDPVGIRVHDLATNVTRTLLAPGTDWDHSPDSLSWSSDGSRLLFTADVRSRRAVCCVDAKEGGTVTVLRADSSSALHGEFADGSRFLTSVQSLVAPTELYSQAATPNGDLPRQLTHFNTDRVAATALGRPEEFTYVGAEGEEVQAWLVRPAGFTEEDEAAASAGNGKKFPLAVLYHGGPQGSSGDDWHYRWNLQFYASAGFAVLAPNFHGSTGFGHDFCKAISGNWEVGGTDVIAGVRSALDAHPWLDAGRVAGLGASYGGYVSNWLNGHAPPDMFAALVCHCGTFDLRSSYYATEELFFMETEFGGPPFGDDARRPDSTYNQYTPSAKVREWKTPTLVIHGARDYRLVESEGLSTFTALQRQGVPSELLYLPGENHHCLNLQNSMVWHETVERWIKQWTA